VIYVAETIDTNTDVLYGNGQGNVSFVKWLKLMGQPQSHNAIQRNILFSLRLTAPPAKNSSGMRLI
jgi:hypothetical protein